MILIWVSLGFSATIATASLPWPINCSPIINSLVVVDCVTIEARVILGDDGSLVSADSNTDNTSIISESLIDMFLSWTLVPNG